MGYDSSSVNWAIYLLNRTMSNKRLSFLYFCRYSNHTSRLSPKVTGNCGSQDEEHAEYWSVSQICPSKFDKASYASVDESLYVV